MLARTLAAACAVAGAFAFAPPALAHDNGAPSLNWKSCGDADDVQCANLKAPLDYDRPDGSRTNVFVARVPATGRRTGVLYLNFGGPGAPIADFLEATGHDSFLTPLNEHFDLIGMDPRGTGGSGQVDCKANQETQGLYSEPFTTPFNLNTNALLAKDSRYIARCLALNDTSLLSHASTANVARDMDLLRRSLGEQRINYLGFSYGTFLGATYASLFPKNYRALVLDGPVDANDYINAPTRDLQEQSAGLERELGRFFQACASDQTACLNFGGADPWDAYDELIDRANAHPLPAAGYAPDPRPVKGDDIIAASTFPMYSKFEWPDLAKALAAAQAGDGSLIRKMTDEDFYVRDADTGQYDPGSDGYFLLGADEQKYPHDLGFFLDAGDHSWGLFDHFYWNTGYDELNYALYPLHDNDAYDGPFRIPNSAGTALVVATTYDPATPYRPALRLARDLGNARVLTMRGDGHTAYANGSPDCIDPAVEKYVNTLALPPAGTSCKQDVPFEQPQGLQKALVKPGAQFSFRLHARPLR